MVEEGVAVRVQLRGADDDGVHVGGGHEGYPMVAGVKGARDPLIVSEGIGDRIVDLNGSNRPRSELVAHLNHRNRRGGLLDDRAANVSKVYTHGPKTL